MRRLTVTLTDKSGDVLSHIVVPDDEGKLEIDLHKKIAGKLYKIEVTRW